ncbi:MAG: type II secretion system protein [Candidatus Pacebacteria bacterium]|jgi:prepilin-type N-terminal cleavage/methylation domain-containing protein|nr:type II secretion system protein [Candidatus Paceibacterota bacterium]MBT4652681.1 type II secretion system protein [Candidatus Paceibacterota bacterium]MBT6755838.1 type II secretion system protein [Candidatus Paceibacterota bacterium]MBT6921051.1 type II secretion system protein [Candidatus Paceibacterota bacterium]
MKKIFSLLNQIKQQAGFTMIELLIVIGILGILAVAVLAAINPIEQINRGRDTGNRSDAEQLISAIDRYYAFNGFYPWQVGASDSGNVGLAWVHFEDSTLTDSGGTCPIAEKIGTASTVGCTGADELKQSFLERVSQTTYNYLYLYNSGTQGASTYACFAPKSNAFVQEVDTRLDPDGDDTLDNYPADYPAASAIGNTAQCGAIGNCVCLP